MKNLNILKTIRFKMTMIYSLVVFVFALLFVGFINLVVANHLQATPVLPRMQGSGNRMVFEELSRVEQQRIREIREDDLSQIRQISLLSLIPLCFGSFAAGYYLSGKMLQPLAKVNKAIASLEADSLNYVLDLDTAGDELGELVNNFNQMSTRLHNSFEQQKQFVQDAAHEIKTPLAVIQTNLDTIVSDQSASKAELLKSIEQSLYGVQSLNQLTESLLTLSLPSNDLDQEINIGELVQEQVDSLKGLAKDKNIELKVDLDEKIHIIKGNRYLAGRAIYNLLENALKYSQEAKEPHVEVRLSKSKSNSGVQLTISNNGASIPKNQLPYIFDRFYRVDKSRSRKQGGFGLGLAIVKKIVEEHGWEIEASSKEGNSTFRIEFA